MEEPRHYFSALIASVLVGLFFATAIIDYRVGVNWFIQSVLCFGAVAYMLALDDNLDKKQLAFWGVIFANVCEHAVPIYGACDMGYYCLTIDAGFV